MATSYFEQKITCRVGGNDLAYYRAGAGQPVLLVHGITTYSFIWAKIIPFLLPSHEVVAVDLLGCGDSDKPLHEPYSLTAHAGRLAEFAEQIGLPRFHFVGHDLGGGIGQIFAVHHPERLFDLTLINSVAYDFWPVQPIVAMRTPVIREILMSAMDLGAFRILVKRGMYHKAKVTDELMDRFMKPMLTAEGRKGFLHFARCLNNRDLTDLTNQLHALDLPVLILRGNADAYLPAAVSEQLHRNLSNARLARIATGGHFLMEDEPEWVATTLLEFLDHRLG